MEHDRKGEIIIDPYKIAFISCVNDEPLYSQCVHFIKQLVIPAGFSIEIIPIFNAKSMTSGYNRGMRSSNAKYKVYLHQDTFLHYPLFLEECIHIFRQDTSIGMIGITGTRKLPATGTWWEGEDLLGKFYAIVNGNSVLFTLHDSQLHYEKAQTIDGALIVTQVDMDWDEQIADFHFYDASQAINFGLHGYQVVVPSQPLAWITHYREHDTDVDRYEHFRHKFLQLYGRFFLPLGSD
ncbi:glycosyltransferase family protein [Paenibacillus terrigena]|uniref:glycosyltransferase family protein n=1 Tax=Paenibacillus terrigena TaxID=369333 RepID=UPI000361F820|nr:glycosyltransferase family protein [Paenibacillus terrigena]